MRAVIYARYGQADVLEVVQLPVPRPRRGQVLVRVHAAALNPKDVVMRRGKFRMLAGGRLPRRVAYDFAGEVVRAGAGVRGLAPGARVYGMLNGFRAGAAAEYVVARAGELAPMPRGLSFTEAAAIPLAAQTALQALRDVARVRPGAEVVINGASGGVGTFAVQLARHLGARVTSLSSERNLALCRELGAHEALDYRQADVLARRWDVFFDVFGNHTWRRVRPALRPGGVYVQTVPSPRIVLDQLATLVTPTRARLVVVKSRARDLRELAHLVEAGALRPVVDREYPLEEVRAAQEHLETKHARGKVVLRVDGA